jgi:starch synthase
MQKRLTIAHVAAEIHPFSKSGGLGVVLGSLPKTQHDLGHFVLTITPFYERHIDTSKFAFDVIAEDVPIEVSKDHFEHVDFLVAQPIQPDNGYNGIAKYFIRNSTFFGGQEKLYGYERENARFMLFNVASLTLLKFLDIHPDIINCHDWHAGLIPYFLKGRYSRDSYWKNTATVFTIHNLTYQLGHNWWEIPVEERDQGRSQLPHFNDPALERINFAKRAILTADSINAVSETYRAEIMTKDFGQELDRILKNRQNIFFGIVNGIDYDAYNPLTDPGLYRHYSSNSLGRRKVNKRALQKYYGLEQDDNVPLICMTSRIVEQKGFRLIMSVMLSLMRIPIQMIIMGDGDKEMQSFFKGIAEKFPKQFTIVPYDNLRETSLYAGSDMFLLPSRFEPCGINQLIAMRYGCVPIVHHIGGLADTVIDYNPIEKTGNGFVFDRYSSRELLVAIARATETFKHRSIWNALIKSDMNEANSWLIPAQKYIDLYYKTLRIKKRSANI